MGFDKEGYTMAEKDRGTKTSVSAKKWRRLALIMRIVSDNTRRRLTLRADMIAAGEELGGQI